MFDTQPDTGMTRLLLDSQTTVFLFQVIAMERWAAVKAAADDLLRVEHVLVWALLPSLLLLCFHP